MKAKFFLVWALVIGVLPPPVWAGMITGEAVFLSESEQEVLHPVEQQRKVLLEAVSRAEVIEQLAQYGVSHEVAVERISALSHAEVQQYHQMLIEDDAAGAGISLLGVFLVVFIVLIITDMMCATNIFPFVKCVD